MEPRILGVVFAGSVISLSIVYTQVPMDQLLARELGPRHSYDGAELAPLPGFRQTPKTALLGSAAATPSAPTSRQARPASVSVAAKAEAVPRSRQLASGMASPGVTGNAPAERLVAKVLPVAEIAGPVQALAADPKDAPPGTLPGVAALAQPPAVPIPSGTTIPPQDDAGRPEATAPDSAGLTQEPGKTGLGTAQALAVDVAVPPSVAPAAASPASTAIAPAPAAQPAATLDKPAAAPVVGDGKPMTASLAKLSNPVQGFDLGTLREPARTPHPKTPAVAPVPAPRNLAARPAMTRGRAAVGRGRDRMEGDAIFHQTTVSFDDRPASSLSVRIGMGGDLSLRLGDLLSLCKTDMVPAVFAHLAASSAASEFVSFETLRNAGIDVRYDAGKDRLVISSGS